MNLLFGRTISLQLRLSVAVVLSIALIVGDRYTVGGSMVRTGLNTLVSPLLYLANVPYELLNLSVQNLQTKEQLRLENEQLKEKQLMQGEQLQQLAFLLKENKELRALLGSSAREANRRLIAQVLSVHSNPYSHQVVINRGTVDGAFEGQPVIDEMGIVGQLLKVGTTTSRVILMTDTTHATPVRILRNDVRTVVEGIGKLDKMRLSHVPHSLDIRIGDVLVTSGLGGTFPEGYPVAVVTEINRDEGRPFAQVYAEPVAQLDRIRLLVLLWKQREGQP
ncbi:rod shape-determining protein MreC [Pseudoalteromonas xiamenensis]|jgi:rod shape-determining protein MreC|uniref:Cell shape-determining protein MreC n=1 Tax=Pseudoalteromonas xiamenensis TaxID=882626 RepID=A0A975DK97_9GAMM|nr:rod shape-determining protein MreC [Pseudoalteromonas xiamenensis]QTH72665.1 rod shape-determining protein MreC [Pseudoalteromonas xiamenensis]WMN61295.1 rod shape-determining protein MreC [Pseudoalteromonas xiamenensis]